MAANLYINIYVIVLSCVHLLHHPAYFASRAYQCRADVEVHAFESPRHNRAVLIKLLRLNELQKLFTQLFLHVIIIFVKDYLKILVTFTHKKLAKTIVHSCSREAL
jgi:hypothetical protein